MILDPLDNLGYFGTKTGDILEIDMKNCIYKRQVPTFEIRWNKSPIIGYQRILDYFFKVYSILLVISLRNYTNIYFIILKSTCA